MTTQQETDEVHVVGVGTLFKPFYETKFYGRAHNLVQLLRNMGYKRAFLFTLPRPEARRKTEFSSS